MLQRTKKKPSPPNLLEMKPLLRSHFQIEKNEENQNLCKVLLPRMSWIERFSIRFLNQPLMIKVQLDSLGSFVIQRCEGVQTVQQISDDLLNQFGEEAEPILPRLATFLEMIEVNGWIHFVQD
ncbi:Coenzyme PQQ synthesis protein D (PqqD) [Thermoactinomyces sp. DSM 45891]|uniref:PqqD family protein n=1 Tax=Thermoactinomyces sp. DSM 45891 TaxID=1761907 RepID=UPI00091F9711|nr:PqqD family protein [Thermoactinomyces sp. DSM 45891]SFX42323.1 Coenzyme PQQ synthesis protein D (PqqD) [Thermoactinomyces sp. DSM 45891]